MSWGIYPPYPPIRNYATATNSHASSLSSETLNIVLINNTNMLQLLLTYFESNAKPSPNPPSRRILLQYIKPATGPQPLWFRVAFAKRPVYTEKIIFSVNGNRKQFTRRRRRRWLKNKRYSGKRYHVSYGQRTTVNYVWPTDSFCRFVTDVIITTTEKVERTTLRPSSWGFRVN